jgi:transcriptional regulator with XRE-family HTH domain
MVVVTDVLAYRLRMIRPGQIRAARGLLGWTQAQLARAAGLSEVAVKNLERGRTDPRASTLTAIQEAFDRAGVVFLDPGDTRNGGSGVRLKE